MAFQFGGGTNTLVPSDRATNGLIIGFSRNIRDYPINRYGQIMPVTQDAGKYVRWLSQQEARFQDNDGRANLWLDGADRPSGINNREQFTFDSYVTSRYDFPVTLGRKAVEQASWQILPAHVNMVGNQAMKHRTLLGVNALVNATWGTNTAAVDGGLLAGGQNWGNGDNNKPNMKNSLLQAAAVINKLTNGTVSPRDMQIVINPNTAIKMASSPEIHNALVQSRFAMAQMTGDDAAIVEQWGLPPNLYGFGGIVVEDNARITSNQGATTPTYQYIVPDATAFLVSRPGGLVTMEGSPAYSTLLCFMYEEFTVESHDDPQNRRLKTDIVSDFQWQVTSPNSGFKLTSLFG